MIKAYTAANLQDAHILLGLLAASGIKARILNASAQGGLGEIPFTHAYPELWLDDARDAARARALIEEFERPARAEPPRRCPNCQEDNPARFEVCWKCGTAIAPD
jgi:putative signal transducing protein